ncbi:ABC transporter ATP-binding protein, partial [Helicobacter japonicus]
MNIIAVKNLYTQYNDVIIHNGISFNVKKGEIFGILGGSGSGKSTLLKNMLFLQKPTSGEITFFGEDIWALREDKRDKILNRCGVMFQFGALFSSMNVLDNVAFLLIQKSQYDKQTIYDISKMWLELVGLNVSMAEKYPYELSGGMKKRVALARALALSPDILFLDEPTSGLDLQSAERFDMLIVKLKEILKITIVMVTHDLDSIKDSVDRLILLEDKQIVFEGSLNE